MESHNDIIVALVIFFKLILLKSKKPQTLLSSAASLSLFMLRILAQSFLFVNPFFEKNLKKFGFVSNFQKKFPIIH